MKRARGYYFSFLMLALALFGLAATITAALDGSWALGLLRFVVLVLAIGSSLATWGTAVMIASVHKVSWPLFLTTTLVVLAGATFAVTCFLAPSPRL